MNDRYLCKAKRTDNGKWVKGNLVWSDDADNNYRAVIIPKINSNMFLSSNDGDLGFENWYLVDTETICQCTGLTDKNGKLIWENDIVKHYNHPDLPDWYDTGAIQWDDIGLRFKRTSAMCEEDVCINISCIYDVIGNIFDNPELLEA